MAERRAEKRRKEPRADEAGRRDGGKAAKGAPLRLVGAVPYGPVVQAKTAGAGVGDALAAARGAFPGALPGALPGTVAGAVPYGPAPGGARGAKSDVVQAYGGPGAQGAAEALHETVDAVGEALGPGGPGAGVEMLAFGSQGPSVSALQEQLNAWGAQPPLDIDGIFGPATQAAVLSFQRDNGLLVDGIVGPQTWSALDQTSTVGGTESGADESNGRKWQERSPEEDGWGVLAETPEAEAAVCYEEGNKAYEAGQWAEAIDWYERAYSLAQIPQMERYYMAFNLGDCHGQLGHYDEAISYMQEGLLSDEPGMHDIGLDKIRVWRARSEGREAEEVGFIDEATKAEATARCLAHGTKGRVLLWEGGDAAGARAEFQQGYDIGEAEVGPRMACAAGLGVCLVYQKDDIDLAVSLLQESLNDTSHVEGGDATVLDWIRRSRASHPERANAELRELGPAEMEAELLAADTAYLAGDYETALKHYELVYVQEEGLEDQRPHVIAQMGVCLQRLGRFDKAIEMFEEHIALGVDAEYSPERIRQCRMKQVGTNVYDVEDPEEAAGEDGTKMLLGGQVFFVTGTDGYDAVGEDTISSFADLIAGRAAASPAGIFRVVCTGGASNRWVGASPPERERLNQELSEQRARKVAEDIVKVCTMFGTDPARVVIEDNGVGCSQTVVPEDPNDNTWWERIVDVTVYGPGGKDAPAPGKQPPVQPPPGKQPPVQPPPGKQPPVPGGSEYVTPVIREVYARRQPMATNEHKKALHVLDRSASGPWAQLAWPDVQRSAAERVFEPTLIDQHTLPVCGPASVVHAMADSNPVGYAALVHEVFTSGAVDGDRVCDDLLANAVAPGMDPGDWMLLSALRDLENEFFDYRGTPGENFRGMSTPDEVQGWMEKLLSCVETKELTSYLFGEIDNAKEVSNLLSAHPQDVFVMLMVDADRMKGSDKGANVPNHFVRLLAPMDFRGDSVTMTVYTWGGIKTYTYHNEDAFEDVLFDCVVGAKKPGII